MDIPHLALYLLFLVLALGLLKGCEVLENRP
jgi:hypothetical protein